MFLFILLIFIFIFHVGRFGEKYPVRVRESGVGHFGRGREPNVHRSLQRKGSRRDGAQNCSVQRHLENTPEHSVLV